MNTIIPILFATIQSLVEPRLYAPSNYVFVAIPTSSVIKVDYSDETPYRGVLWNFAPTYSDYDGMKIVGANLAIAPCIAGNNFAGDAVRLEDFLWLLEAIEERRQVVGNFYTPISLEGDSVAGRLNWYSLYAPTPLPFRFITSPPSQSAAYMYQASGNEQSPFVLTDAVLANPYENFFSNTTISAGMPLRRSDAGKVFEFLSATASNCWTRTAGTEILGNYTKSTPYATTNGLYNCIVTYANHVPSVSITSQSASYSTLVTGSSVIQLWYPAMEFSCEKRYSVTSWLTNYTGDDNTGHYQTADSTDVQEWTYEETKDTINNNSLFISGMWETNAISPDGMMRLGKDYFLAIDFVCEKDIEHLDNSVVPARYIINDSIQKHIVLVFGASENPVASLAVSNAICGGYSTSWTFTDFCHPIPNSINFFANEYNGAFQEAFSLQDFGEVSYRNPEKPTAYTYSQLVAMAGSAHLGYSATKTYTYRETQKVRIYNVALITNFNFKYRSKEEQ